MTKCLFKRSDPFLDQVLDSVLDEIDSKGYARRKVVTLRLWQDHKLCKRASLFMLQLLAEKGEIQLKNRGVYHGC